jgi:hypothetical protein
MMCIGFAPHNKIEAVLFTVMQEILKFFRQRGILGIGGQVAGMQNI